MKKILFGVLMAMAAAGCTEYESGEVEQMLKDGKIVFSVSQAPTASDTRTIGIASEALQLSGAPQEYWLLPEIEPMVTNMTTRGTQLTSADFMTSFGVSCYKTPNGMDDLGGRTPDYFYNLKASRVGETSNYTISQDYYWPSNDERLWFYAYYPYNSGENKASDNPNVVLSSAATTGPQTIDYTVAAAATDQVDLMTAKTGKTDDFLTEGSPSVELQFEHQLTGIRFKVGDQFPTKGYIQSIQLKNVYTHGVYTIGGTWSHESTDIGNFIVEYANDTKVTDTPGQMITDDNAVFLMIPATFTYDANTVEDNKAKIIVRFWDGDATQTVEASLEGTTWTAGQTVTYSLSSEKLTTLKIDHIDYATTVDGAPYTEWKNGDEIGLYVVANGKNGGTDLRYTNVKCTYSKPLNAAGTWSIAQVVENDEYKPVIMYPGDNYYFYYPYNADGPDGTPSAGNESDASADKFWNSVTTAHTVLVDQSTPANFKKSDLQVAKADVPTPTNGLAASSISATMSRKVGLAVITLGSKNVPTRRTFNSTSTVLEGSSYSDSESTTTIYATSSFNGNQPLQNGVAYYYYTLPGVETSFNSDPSALDAWQASVSVTLAAGQSSTVTPVSSREFIYRTWRLGLENTCVTIPIIASGTFEFNIYGARGYGSDRRKGTSSNAGWGGRAYGTAELTAGTNIYVTVGGSPDGSYGDGTLGGYNGGGSGRNPNGCLYYGSGGGGCTSVIVGTVKRGTGLLKDWKNNTGEVLLVAGGGGGTDDGTGPESGASSGDDGSGGDGGGENGQGATDNGVRITSYGVPGSGGTQSSGYAFGEGGPNSCTYNTGSSSWISQFEAPGADGGGGGGGWYGGYGCGGVSTSMGGGGGSGYTKSTLTNRGMETGVNFGDGYAYIQCNAIYR